MKKVLKSIIAVSLLATASSSLADGLLLLSKEQISSTQQNHIESKRYNSCVAEEKIVNNKNEVLFFDGKGEVASLQIISLLNFDNLYQLKGTKYFSAIKFMKDGIFYGDKIYKFNQNFSNDFFNNFLREGYVFEVACIKAKKYDEDNQLSSRNMKTLSNIVILDDENQFLIEQFVLEYGLYILSSNSDGGILVSNNPDDEIKNFADKEELKNKIQKYRKLNNEAESIILDTQKKDAIAKEEAKKRKENSIIHINADIFKKFQNLKAYRKEI